MGTTGFDELVLTKGVSAANVAAKGNLLLALRQAGAASVATKRDFILVPVAGTIIGVRAYADTAPVTGSLIVDVNKNGTTLFTTQGNRPTILTTANASSTTLPDITAVAAGDRISFDIDAVGSGTAGSDVYVSVLLKVALVD